jgi:hypothetical protein
VQEAALRALGHACISDTEAARPIWPAAPTLRAFRPSKPGAPRGYGEAISVRVAAQLRRDNAA